MNCGRALQQEWKFCIYCGAPARAGDHIPSAIRPSTITPSFDDDPENEFVPIERRRRRIDVPLLVGLVLGVAGIALVIYMSIVLGGSA